MCLSITGSQKRPTTRRILRWKLYYTDNIGLESIIFSHNKNGCITGPGTFVSSHRSCTPTKRECRDGTVDRGFHVYTSRRAAEDKRDSSCGGTIVPVWCRSIDFIARQRAVGEGWDRGEAVYRAITITPTAFRRATQ